MIFFSTLNDRERHQFHLHDRGKKLSTRQSNKFAIDAPNDDGPCDAVACWRAFLCVGGWVGGVFFTSRKQTKFRQIVDGTQVSHDKAKLIKGIIYELQSFSGLF